VIVAINLAGTAFGFWYYIPQSRPEPVLAWPVVPDSPTATSFIACSLALYRLGRSNEYRYFPIDVSTNRWIGDSLQ